MYNVGIYCQLQCQCQFILVNLIHLTCLCRKHAYRLMKLLFRTSFAISDTRGELPDPPFDLRVELVVDHRVQAAPVLALNTLARHPGCPVRQELEEHSLEPPITCRHLPLPFLIPQIKSMHVNNGYIIYWSPSFGFPELNKLGQIRHEQR